MALRGAGGGVKLAGAVAGGISGRVWTCGGTGAGVRFAVAATFGGAGAGGAVTGGRIATGPAIGVGGARSAARTIGR